ncbi:MAG: class II aldolase/adducin family protein [Nitrososphaerota archaeon]|nr:class II aldolase/adducin family protein [Nitrososphaerota archaeon]
MSTEEKLKDELAHTIRRLYERGLVSGVGGNASILLSSGKTMLITPSGYFKGGVAKGDLVTVSISGHALSKGKPSSEMPTHLLAYRLRKDIRAVVHAHPPAATAMISAGIDIPPMTPEHSVMVTKLSVVDFAPPGEEGALAVKGSLKDCDVVGIRNHGFFSLGPDLHEAASRLEVLEESAKIYMSMRQLGKISMLQEDVVKRIRAVYSRE